MTETIGVTYSSASASPGTGLGLAYHLAIFYTNSDGVTVVIEAVPSNAVSDLEARQAFNARLTTRTRLQQAAAAARPSAVAANY
jgi:hypothetical protein